MARASQVGGLAPGAGQGPEPRGDPAIEVGGLPAGSASGDDFELADWRVQPSLNRLSRGGRTGQLEPKLMDVLAFLARSAGEVVSKHDITDAVLASSVRLWALAEQHEDTSPFLHGFTPPIYLGNLRDGEARALIRQEQLPSPRRPAFDDATVEAIRRRCGNHPYLIQLVCRRLLEIGDLAEVFDEVASDPMVSFLFAADFELLTAGERTVLGWLAERPAAAGEELPMEPGRLRASLQRLRNLGFVDRDGERRYRLVNGFFRRWLQEMPPVRPP